MYVQRGITQIPYVTRIPNKNGELTVIDLRPDHSIDFFQALLKL